MSKKTGFTLQDHLRHSCELKKAQDCLRRLATDLGNSRGRTSKAYRRAMRADKAIGLLVSEMDNL
ncbi:MAG: hypothetical protein ABFD91_10680, partial [Anaerohalosphaeraceae bacterium]